MAINVDLVYKTVLLILNKEQRGYLTPDEFNKVANQVQLELFEKYFEDLNQLLRVAEVDDDYADRINTLQDNIAVFEVSNPLTFNGTTWNINTLLYPQIHRLGSIQYEPIGNVDPVRLQETTQQEFNLILRSKLTKPSKTWPVFVKRGVNYFIYPSTITDNIQAYYVRKPVEPKWDYEVNPNTGAYEFTPVGSGSVNFELSDIEQTEVVLKILQYTGVIIRDPQIIQTAAQLAAAEDVNEKS